MDYLVKIRSVQTPLNGQFSIGANSYDFHLDKKSCLVVGTVENQGVFNSFFLSFVLVWSSSI